jgi:hypothetical protein
MRVRGVGGRYNHQHSTIRVVGTTLVSLYLVGTCEARLPGFSATRMMESGVADAPRLLSDFFFGTRNRPLLEENQTALLPRVSSPLVSRRTNQVRVPKPSGPPTSSPSTSAHCPSIWQCKSSEPISIAVPSAIQLSGIPSSSPSKSVQPSAASRSNEPGVSAQPSQCLSSFSFYKQTQVTGMHPEPFAFLQPLYNFPVSSDSRTSFLS